MKKAAAFLFTLSASIFSYSQQTVGLFQAEPDSHPGYILFAPFFSDSTFLIDNCGHVQHIWASNYSVAAGVELTETGELVRGCSFAGGTTFSGGGSGGRIEALGDNSNVLWSFTYSDNFVRHHHDFTMMPNGNVLVVAWELKSQADAIQNGRNPAFINPNGVWPDHIVEYSPGLGTIVWEWHSWDHLIQDFDPSKDNYGVVEDHPELIDINFTNSANADWQHFNSIDYNPSLDQILISSPVFDEIYIIDHSTTTLEAAGHTGGNSGKGGDLLWRWGNSATYGGSSPQQLFFQHDATWIKSGNPSAGKIMVFNNGSGRTPVEYSSVDIIEPVLIANNNYEMGVNGFLPENNSYSYSAPNPTDFYSGIISSAQELSSGNIFINEGNQGHFFEINTDDEVVWDYVNPVVQDSIVAQEQVVPGNPTLYFNGVFRARKIEMDFSGLDAITLVDNGPLERDPYPQTCFLTQQEIVVENEMHVYPNPADDILYIDTDDYETIDILDNLGKKIITKKITDQMVHISELSPGIYFVEATNVKNSQKNITRLIKL